MKDTYGLQRPHGDSAPSTPPPPVTPVCEVCRAPSAKLVCDGCLGLLADSNARRERIAAGDLNVCHDANATAADVEAVLAARTKTNHSGVQNS